MRSTMRQMALLVIAATAPVLCAASEASTMRWTATDVWHDAQKFAGMVYHRNIMPVYMDLYVRVHMFTIRLGHLLHASHPWRFNTYMSVLNLGLHPMLLPGREVMRSLGKMAGYEHMMDHHLGLALLMAISTTLTLVMLLLRMVTRSPQRRASRGMHV